MKKRLIAILLCLATVVSFAVPGTLAFGETVGAQLFLDGAAVSEASFPVNEKLTLAVGSGTDGACQWQLYIPGIDAWVNIQGQTGVTCNVSYAMLSNALDGNGQAKIRASVDTGSGLVYSNEAVITPEEAGQSNDAPAMLKAVRPSASQNSTANTTTPSVSDEELDALFAEADRAEAAKGVASAKAGAANAELQQAQARYNAALAAVNANPAADLEKAQADFDAADAALSSAQTEYDAANAALNAAQDANDVEAATAAAANVQSATAALAQANSSYNVASAALSSAKAAANAAGDSSTAQAELDAATAALDEAKAKAEAAKAELEAAEAAYAKADAALNAALEGSSTGNTDSSTYETSTPSVANKVHYTINYVFEDNSIVSEPYTAELAVGTSFSATVKFPEVQGYLPYVGETQQNEYKFEVTSVTDGVSITVVYKPALVNYTVIHYQQNVDNDNYTLTLTEHLKGYTGSKVGSSFEDEDRTSLEIVSDGFYALLYEKPEIAADGSTVVEIYYDRTYYLMNFNLDGGYGTEPIYARFGAAIGDIATPTKAGYSFAGWKDEDGNDAEIPQTMPAGNSTYFAMWGDPNAVNYTVVYWKENPNDSDYSYWGSETKSATTGSKVSGSDSIPESIHNGEKQYFTYNAEKTQKDVEIKGDGSSIVNVYYKRNVYTLTFGFYTHEEHSHFLCPTSCDHFFWWDHDDSCYTCGKIAHTHGEGCYPDIVVKTISAKYQQDIRSNFPIIGTDSVNYEGYWWLVPDEGEPFFEPDTYVVSIDTMPGKNITFTGKYKGNNAKIYYYIETLNGQNGATTYNKKNFDLYKTVITSQNGYLTYLEEFHDITGFTQWKSDPAFSSHDATPNIKAENYLYYTRNSYKLKYYNYNGYLTANEATLQYQAPLTNYNVANPSYPSGLEPNAYEFEGWYTTENCVEGTKVDFTKMTMPASDVTLYAKWVPVSHTVEFYLDKDALDAGEELSTHTKVSVPHGEIIDPVPANPKNEGYNFIGWFYLDENGNEKAYDFENMPVRKDLQVYGKWNSNVLKEYTIYFKIKDTDTEIADSISGSALAGNSKTFDAKGNEQLYEKYKEGYFPETKSHTIQFTVENDNNTFTFWYVRKDAVPYTVYYVSKTTDKGLGTITLDGEEYFIVRETKTNEENRKAVVTETFEVVEGMMPDAYQKRLVVSADGKDNIIIFVYEEDTEHAYYKISHYTQNVDGKTWTEYASSQIVGDIGETYFAEPIEISGFTYDEDVEGTLTSGKLTANGLHLKLYYTRNVYPYQVRYLENVTGKQLADPKNDSAKYEEVVKESAIDIAGYKKLDPNEQSIVMKIEEDKEAKLNIITFYYEEEKVTINYVAVGPDGSVLGANNNIGNVSPNSETIKVLSGTAEGSTATPAENFRLVGWYTDEACTQKVTDADGTVDASGKFVPAKKTDKDDPEKTYYVADTYYAKFEYNLTTLTITKTVDAGPGNGPDGFIFDVYEVNSDGELGTKVATVAISGSGSTTIHGLTVGKTYQVIENSAWSCWYSASGDNNPITLKASGNEVKVSNTYSYENILHGGHSVTNRNPVVNN